MSSLSVENIAIIENLAYRSKRGERLTGNDIKFLSECADADEDAYDKAHMAGAERATREARDTNHNRAILR